MNTNNAASWGVGMITGIMIGMGAAMIGWYIYPHQCPSINGKTVVMNGTVYDVRDTIDASLLNMANDELEGVATDLIHRNRRIELIKRIGWLKTEVEANEKEYGLTIDTAAQ